MMRWLLMWCVFAVGLVEPYGAQAAECRSKPQLCNDRNLCRFATFGSGYKKKSWQYTSPWDRWADEAKRRKLSCKVSICETNPATCSIKELCSLARWSGDTKFKTYAENQNIPCDIETAGTVIKLEKNTLQTSFERLSLNNRKRIQSALAYNEYYTASIDGLYGKGTAAALKSYNREYLNNAPLSESANVEALLNDILKAKTLDRETDPKLKLTLNFEEGGLKVELGSGETAQAKEPVTPLLLDFAQVKASYDAGNYSQAFKDAQILSVDGNPDAQLYLGKMYADGRGTLQVTTYAHMWFNISSMNGSNEAFEERKLIQKQMTPELINEAQGMAVACIKSDYKDCGFLFSENKTMANNNRISPSADDLRYYFLDQSKLKRKQIQYALKRLRYYPSSVDGLYGKGTARALSDYLKDRENIQKLSEIYLNLTTEVDVPASFKEQSQVSAQKPKVVKSEPKPDTSSQGYTKAQAQAICEPQADLAGMNAANAYRPRTRSIDCFGYGSIVSCNQGSSGGAWGGVLQGFQIADAKKKAYRATMDACMAQHGWY